MAPKLAVYHQQNVILYLPNGDISIADATQYRIIGRYVNDEWESMCKEKVVNYFKVIHQYLTGGTTENKEELPDSYQSGQHFILGPRS
jgi:hypothetical protein